MKSLLILAAALAPLLAAAQYAPPPPVANPNPLPAGDSAPAVQPGASPAPAPGSTHDAAATVPLPGQASPSSGPNLEKNVPLIPDSITTTTTRVSHGHSHGARAAASPHLVATFQTEQDIRVRVHLRQAETRAFEDPRLQALWDAAKRAPTDPERRAILKSYYNLLYDRMLKFDPQDADRIAVRRESSLTRLKYVRIGDPDQDSGNSGDQYVSRPAAHDFGPNPPANESPQGAQ